MDILLVGAQQYLFFVIYFLVAFGAGFYPVKLLKSQYLIRNQYMRLILTVTVGIGIIILLLFYLALFGLLEPNLIALLLVILLLIGIIHAKDLITNNTKVICLTKTHPYLSCLLGLLVLPLLIKPLQLPNEWDELMYHLPHAQIWAEQGKLTVNEHIRYALFTYNFNLLYSAALIFDQPVFTHQIHTLMMWFTAFGIYFFSCDILKSKVSSLIAALLFIGSNYFLIGTAYIDLGLTAFLFFSFVLICAWWQYKENSLLYLAVFFLGISVGIKYHALLYMPIFLMLVLFRERRISVLMMCLGVFLITGCHWYIYNYLISGNPIHPLGGSYFGYWIWSENDIQAQLKDINRIEWPEFYYFLAVFSVFFIKRNSITLFALLFVSVISVVIWYATSGYQRYISYSYPYFAILSSFVIESIYLKYQQGGIFSYLNAKFNVFYNSIIFKLLILCAIFLNSVYFTYEYSKRIRWNEKDISDVYKRDFELYELLEKVDLPKETRLYQLGFENQIFLSNYFLAGDWFGPNRYKDFLRLKSNPEAMSEFLKDRKLDGFVINNTKSYTKLDTSVAFEDFFILKEKTARSSLYLLR